MVDARCRREGSDPALTHIRTGKGEQMPVKKIALARQAVEFRYRRAAQHLEERAALRAVQVTQVAAAQRCCVRCYCNGYRQTARVRALAVSSVALVRSAGYGHA
jgi:hypothetical protein